ncbi:M3 family metallopeptidase [Pseudomonas muyukensis]|uniref:Peptidase M3 n=1 Tax=Pseudomonas muyukensis TaxID=2842357 RepID=A0ABX8MBE7_9PSED|nr:M3 family metallopeptidase [Pseudomonas muyukensis]QXH35788.1 peptidase M3 [Pseudomonas muyukensis]
MSSVNPLLQPSATPVDYAAVTLANAREAFAHALTAHRDGIARIIAQQRELPTWDDLVLAIDELDAQLNAVLLAASPLAYQGDDWVRLLNESYGQLLSRFDEKLACAQLRDLYQQLAERMGMNLDAHERATLQWYRDAFVRHGAQLDEAGKGELAQINEKIQELAYMFGENMQLPGTHVSDPALLAGLPVKMREALAAQARLQGKSGWLIGTDVSSTQALLDQAAERSLREAVYRRHHQRGVSSDAQQDNGTHLLNLALQREKKARLLGFADYPALSLRAKSAGNPEQLRRFLNDLAARIKPLMIKRREALQAQAHQHGLGVLQPWDRRYVQTLERQARQLLTLDTFREFFPLPKVIDALVELVRKLFGLKLVADATPATMAVWHPSVRAFEVWLDQALVGYFYLDAEQYPGKQPDLVATRYVRNRRVDAEGRFHPAVVMAFSDVPQGSPALLDPTGLLKLFHEFGHAMHHLLVRTTNHVVSGVSNLGADGVEVFSKLFERWAWDADYLAGISAHQDDGRAIEREALQALLTSLRGVALEQTANDLALALFDLDLHATPSDGRSLRQRLDEARERCGFWPLEQYEHPAHAFEHLLSYYDAGYYAYVWSDVQAFDLFTRFQRNGLLDRASGAALQGALLDSGAARPLQEGMRAFLGREPNADAFLAWHGLS